MFPEYRELITKLKTTNSRFSSLFDKHNRLDHEILRMEGPQGNGYTEKVAQLKKEKLKLKDELYQMLRDASQ